MNKRKYSFNKSGKISKDINFFNIKKKQNRKGFPEAYFIVAKRSDIKWINELLLYECHNREQTSLVFFTAFLRKKHNKIKSLNIHLSCIRNREDFFGSHTAQTWKDSGEGRYYKT